MATTVTSTIGSTGDYSTLQAWEDACPSNLVTDDKIWRGEAQNQEFTANLSFGGVTTDSTRYIELTTVSGASFRDNSNVRTNALRYNASNGAAVNKSVSILNAYVRISNFQIKETTYGSALYTNSSATSHRIENCILETTVDSVVYGETSGGTHTYKNVIFIHDTPSTNKQSVQCRNAGNYYFYNCTNVRPSNRSATGNAWFGDWANMYFYNCAAFGFGAFSNGWSNGSHNASDNSISFGSSNQASLTYADQFETTTTASSAHDFRTKAGATLIDTGTDLSGSGVTDDISGTARGATYDIGAWEITGGGGGEEEFIPRVIFM